MENDSQYEEAMIFQFKADARHPIALEGDVPFGNSV
jgi:hypothetical protein